MSVAEKCKQAGISYTTYRYRCRHGWKDPFAKRAETRTISEETLSNLKRNGISRALYFSRRSIGWSEFEASNVRTHIMKVNGKSVFSQLSTNKYNYFRQLVNKGMTVGDAFNKVTKGAIR